jgi:WD40 repeat protein
MRTTSVVSLCAALLGWCLAPPGRADGPAEVSFWDQVDAAQQAVFSPDGKTLTTLTGGEVRPGPTGVDSLALSPDGKLAATAGPLPIPGPGGGVRLWALPTGREKLSPEREAERDRREAARKKREAEQARAKAEQERLRKEALEKLSSEARALAAADAARARRAEYAVRLAQAREACDHWSFRQARELLDGLKPQPGEEDLRGFEWYHLRGQLSRELLLTDDPDLDFLAAAVSPDGDTVAVTGDGAVTLYDAATGKRRATLDTRRPLASVALSPDGRTLAAGLGTTKGRDRCDVLLWDVATGKERATLEGHSLDVAALSFSPDGRTLASGDNTGVVRLWDVAEGKARQVLPGQKFLVNDVAFSPDGKTLVTVVAERVGFWDVASGDAAGELPASRRRDTVAGVAFSPDGRTLAVAVRNQVTLWDVATRKPVLSAPGAEWPLLFLTGDAGLATGRVLFDPRTGRERARRQPSAGGPPGVAGDRVLALGQPSAGRLLAVELERDGVRLCDVPLGERVRRLTGADDASSLAFTADGRHLIAAGEEKGARRWDALTGEPQPVPYRLLHSSTAEFDFAGAKGRVRLDGLELTPEEFAALGRPGTLPDKEGQAQLLAVSPDGKTWATRWNGAVTLRDAATGKARVTLPRSRDRISSGAFTGDGKALVTWDDDVVRWDAATGKELDRFEAPGEVVAVRFAADGKLAALVVADRKDHVLRLHDVATGATVATLRGHTDTVWAVAFSPDGRTLATAGRDRTVRLWDPVTGDSRGVLRGHPGEIYRLAFRPDSRALVALSIGGDVSLWLGE